MGSYRPSAHVHMYDNLNDACKNGDRQLVGYITLLQIIVNDCYLILVFDHFLICSCVIFFVLIKFV